MNIDTQSYSIVRSIAPVIRPDGFTTSALAMSNALTGNGLTRVNERILEVIGSSFPSDEFSAAIASYMYISAFQEKAVELWAAVHGSERMDLLKRIDGLRDNTDDIRVIQEADDYNIEIMPMHAQLVAFEQSKKAIRDKLRDTITIDVLPAASVDDWKATCQFIKSLPKGKAQMLEQVKKRFEGTVGDVLLNVEFGDKFADQLVTFKTAITSALASSVFDEIRPIWPSATSMKANISDHLIAGSMEEKITWPQIVNRIEAIDNNATVLSDLRIAGQYNGVSSFVLDFSKSLSSIVLAPMEFAAADDSNTDARFLTKSESDELSDNGARHAPHGQALLFHILAYAGLDISIGNKNKLSGQRVSRPQANVPLSWNMLHPFFETRLRDSWKIFLPELKQLQFWEAVLPIVKTRQSTFRSVDKLLPPLAAALRSDLMKIVTLVRETAAEGAKFDSTAAIAESLSRFTHYKDEVVTPFADQTIQVTTDAPTAISSKSLTGYATRPLGVIAHPTASSRGFAEAILGLDNNRFGAVTASASMIDVAKLYNAVTDFTGVSSTSLNIDLDIKNAISAALWDCHHKLVRVSEKSFAEFRASEAIFDAAFVNLGGDYHAMLKRESTDTIMLASGYASAVLDMNAAGNVFGSFVYGTFAGKGDVNDENAYNKQFIASMNEIASLIRECYFPKPITVLKKEKSDISLIEENVSYIKRVMMVPDYFPGIEEGLDEAATLRIQTVMHSPLANASFRDAVGVNILKSMRHYDYAVREDVNSLIGLSASRLMSTIREGYSSDVISLFYASISGMLTIKQRQRLMRHEVREGVNSLTKHVGDILKDCGEPLRIIFLNDLLNKFKAEAEKLTKLPDSTNVDNQAQI